MYAARTKLAPLGVANDRKRRFPASSGIAARPVIRNSGYLPKLSLAGLSLMLVNTRLVSCSRISRTAILRRLQNGHYLRLLVGTVGRRHGDGRREATLIGPPG